MKKKVIKRKKVKKVLKKKRAAPVKRATKQHKASKKKLGMKGVPKPIGKVTHFYTEIGVAIVKFNKKVSVGTILYFKGATTDFKEQVKSMQYDHRPVSAAGKGKLIGIKVKQRVREGDAVHLA